MNTVVSIFLPPLSPTRPMPTSHPQSHPHLAPSRGPSFMFIYIPFPSFPHYFPLPSPLVTVSLLSISMSLAIFCLQVCFVDLVPLIGEIIWYLSFTTWLTSLSIMLPSYIHTVVKGKSSFFLSAA